MKLAYIDSCVWIARVEGLAAYRKIIDEKLQELAEEGWMFCYSEAVMLETLIKPIQQKQDPLIQTYRKIFDELRLLKNYSRVFSRALLMAQLENLKAMDAIHVAVAEHYGCGLFVSCDSHFRNLKVLSPFWINLENLPK